MVLAVLLGLVLLASMSACAWVPGSGFVPAPAKVQVADAAGGRYTLAYDPPGDVGAWLSPYLKLAGAGLVVGAVVMAVVWVLHQHVPASANGKGP